MHTYIIITIITKKKILKLLSFNMLPNKRSTYFPKPQLIQLFISLIFIFRTHTENERNFNHEKNLIMEFLV